MKSGPVLRSVVVPVKVLPSASHPHQMTRLTAIDATSQGDSDLPPRGGERHRQLQEEYDQNAVQERLDRNGGREAELAL